jgi:hypothetical protein
MLGNLDKYQIILASNSPPERTDVRLGSGLCGQDIAGCG